MRQILDKAPERSESQTRDSCDVERLISTYNRLKTNDRFSLTPDTIDDNLHISLNMPVVANCNPWDATLLWISEKDRRQIKSASQKDSKYCVGVFLEASDRVEAAPRE